MFSSTRAKVEKNMQGIKTFLHLSKRGYFLGAIVQPKMFENSPWHDKKKRLKFANFANAKSTAKLNTCVISHFWRSRNLILSKVIKIFQFF